MPTIIDFVDDTQKTTTCEFCWENFCRDVWANREIRTFYRLEDGCNCCEHCLPCVTPETESGAFYRAKSFRSAR